MVAACARLLRGRSGLLIAHRPALAAIADRTLVLRDGRVDPHGPLSVGATA